jgi:hypothetical protein
MSQSPAHIFIKKGDALREVDAALARCAARGVDRAGAGFNKYLFATQADQTIVFLASRDAPLAGELRALPGWSEPGDQPLG